MKTELFLYEGGAWKQADLYDDVEVPVVFCVSDVRDFTKVSSSRSETVRLPSTPANERLFRRAWDVTEDGSFEMDARVPARLIVDGEELKLNWAELMSVTTYGGGRTREYELVLFADTAQLFSKMKDYYLRDNDDSSYDVDLSDLDHVMTGQNILNSFFVAPGTGYTYVCVDKQNRSGMVAAQAAQFRYDELTPCVFIKEIWDRLFEMHGFSYDSTFLNSDRFKRLLYPHTDRWMHRRDDEVLAALSSVRGPSVVSVYCGAYSANKTESGTASYLGSASVTQQGSYAAFSNVTGYYTAPVTGVYSLRTAVPWRVGFSSTVSSILCLSGGEMKVVANLVKKSGSTSTIVQSVRSSNVLVDSRTFSGGVIEDLDVLESFTDDVFLYAGEQLYVTLYLFVRTRNSSTNTWLWRQPGTLSEVSVTFTFGGYETVAGELIRLDFELSDRICENSTVPMSSILHKMKQSDFVNSIVKMFNLYIEPLGENRFRIEPRDAYYALGATAVDWTQKLDRSSDIVLESAASLKNSPVVMRYAEDDDFYNNSYSGATGKRYGRYENATGLAGEAYEVEVSFAPTPGGRLCDEHHMQLPKIFKLDSEGQVDEDANMKPRLLYWNGWTAFPATRPDDRFVMCSRYNALDFGRHPYWPAAGHLDAYYGSDSFDLNFGGCDWYWYDFPTGDWVTSSNLYYTYWDREVNELSDPDTKKMTARFMLDVRDVSALRLYTPVLIDGAYWRINKINGFVPGRLTEVELITAKYVYLTYPTKLPRPIRPKPIAVLPPIGAKPSFADVISANITGIQPRLVDSYATLPAAIDDVIDSMGGASIGVTSIEYRSAEDSYDVIDANIREAPLASSKPAYYSKQGTKISDRSDFYP